jgi:ABC transporter substrate binding protein
LRHVAVRRCAVEEPDYRLRRLLRARCERPCRCRTAEQRYELVAAAHSITGGMAVPDFVTGGGLIAYGTEQLDEFRRAANYVDRILKGEKPADLPVQASTKYELVINLKTAKALGVEIPQTLLALADEVIEAPQV